jgi:hypothetical protein
MLCLVFALILLLNSFSASAFVSQIALQCVDVIHPGKANIPKTEVAQKVAQMYKVQQACVMVRLTLLFDFFHIMFTIVKSAFLHQTFATPKELP